MGNIAFSEKNKVKTIGAEILTWYTIDASMSEICDVGMNCLSWGIELLVIGDVKA